MNNHTKLIDFADLDIDDYYNHDIAKELCILLNEFTNFDELASMSYDIQLKYENAINTNDSSQYFKIATVSQQRSMLANHFASFAHGHYKHCYLSLPEYECLRELYLYIREEFAFEDATMYLKLLKPVLYEFEREYSKIDKSFVFTLLSR